MSRHIWHIITPEYPPQLGGVGDYVFLLAEMLAREGDGVEIWCSGSDKPSPWLPGVNVHPILGRLNPSDMLRFHRTLNGFSRPRHLVLQWVPHAYFWGSMNVPFCVWIWIRARLFGDDLGIMLHEPFLGFGEGRWRQNVPAFVHRIMTILLLNAARRVWVSIPRWEKAWKVYTLGRKVPFSWLPLPSNVPVAGDASRTAEVRSRYAPSGQRIVGHFGTFGYPITPMLERIVPALLAASDRTVALFIGPNGAEFKQTLLREHPGLEGRIHAAGRFAATDPALSAHIAACDLMIQPYPDGASSRRTSLLAPLAHGVPLVTTSGWASEPLWQESGAVAIVSAADLDGFVREADRLLNDETARQRAAQASRVLYKNHFAIERIAETLRSFYPETREHHPTQAVV